MARLIVLPAARADLIEIGDFIAVDNPERAASFVAEIEARDEGRGGAVWQLPGTSRPA